MSSPDTMFVVFAMVFAGVVLPTLLVAFDAARNRITTDAKPYTTINGALAWLLLCLLFPTVGLVFYLVRRSLVVDERRRSGDFSFSVRSARGERASGLPV